MARLDVNGNSYEWALNIQMGGHSLFFETSPLDIIADRVDTSRTPRAKQLPKKLTRKIRKSAPRAVFL